MQMASKCLLHWELRLRGELGRPSWWLKMSHAALCQCQISNLQGVVLRHCNEISVLSSVTPTVSMDWLNVSTHWGGKILILPKYLLKTVIGDIRHFSAEKWNPLCEVIHAIDVPKLCQFISYWKGKGLHSPAKCITSCSVVKRDIVWVYTLPWSFPLRCFLFFPSHQLSVSF